MCWTRVKDFENYSVSDEGKILNNISGKILKPYISKGGYLYVVLYGKTRKNLSLHRIVAKNLISNELNYPEVNHIDGNKLNNHISNLEWVTPKMNIQHAIKNGLIIRSRKTRYNSNRGKLTPNDVSLIRILLEKGNSQTNVAKIFKVSQASISSIVRKEFLNQNYNL